MSLARDRIVAAARRWIGTPYLHQASLLHVGCDCLGLVRGIWRDVIGEEPEAAPPYSSDWAETQRNEPLLEALERHFTPAPLGDYRPGDLLAYRFRDHLPVTHLGVATSATHMAHAHAAACVTEVAIGPHWRRRLVAAFSFPGVAD
jgi:NlpC/P60 family putative phage cell wall peptidase